MISSIVGHSHTDLHILGTDTNIDYDLVSGWVSSVRDSLEDIGEIPASKSKTKVYMSLDSLLGSLIWEGKGSVTLTNKTRVEKVDSTSMQITSDIGGGREWEGLY